MKRNPNRLMQILICISVCIHALILIHVAGVYQSNAVQYIELSMSDLSKHLSRAIPRPVHRPKKMEQPKDLKKIRINPSRIPRVQPTRIDPANKEKSSNLMAQIGGAELPSDMNSGGNAYNIGEILDTSGEFTTAKSYYEMVMLKIESSKRYPDAAKAMQKQGRVTVRFILTLQGNIKELEITRSCQHTILDQAAIQAVKDAAPFPRPPYRFFKKEIPMELNIIFETT